MTYYSERQSSFLGTKAKGMARLVLIILIFVIGASFRSQNLLEPWVGHHNAWGGAMYGNIARNFVKYGYWETQLGPVVNSGYVSTADEFEFYYHYPPLLVWLVSLSYYIFGVHEWSARLVPLFFSLSLMGLIFIFARRIFSKNVAVLALLFSAIMPVENYYGAHVDVYGSLSVFFSLLALYGYVRWLENYRAHDLVLCNLGIILGCMVAWYTYFLVPLILVHYCFFYFIPGKSRYYRLLSIAGSAIAVFALFMLHRQILFASGRGEVFGTLIEKLFIRMSYDNMFATSGDKLGPATLVLHHSRDLVRMYSPPLAILTIVWLLLFINNGIGKKLQNRDWFVLILLGYGFLHNLAFPSVISGHDYLTVCYVPGVAIASSVAFIRACQYFENTWGLKTRNVAVSIFLTIIVVTGLYLTQRLYLKDPNHSYTLKRWGEIIRKNSDEDDIVLTPTKSDSVFEYYVDREMDFEIDTPQEVIEKSEENENGYLFICPVKSGDKFKDILARLDGRYPRRNEDGLIIYIIRR